MTALRVVTRSEPKTPTSSSTPLISALLSYLLPLGRGIEVPEVRDELSVLLELGEAALALGLGDKKRRSVRLHGLNEARELGLELDNCQLLVTCFSGGPAVRVLVHERSVEFRGFVDKLLEAIDEAEPAKARSGVFSSLLTLRRALTPLRGPKCVAPRALTNVRVQSTSEVCLQVSVQADLRASTEAAEGRNDCLQRSDLFGLLQVGTLTLTAHERNYDFGSIYPWLLADSLLVLGDEAFEAMLTERPLFRRISCHPLELSVQQTSPKAGLKLTIHGSAKHRNPTFPKIAPVDLALCAQSYATALVEAIVRNDPGQLQNLRLTQLLTRAQELKDRVLEHRADDSLINSRADQYRQYGLGNFRATTVAREQTGKMRFSPRWLAAVPGLDLRAVFLHQERLVVGALREVSCLHAETGHLLWRTNSRTAATVLTPLGVVRWHQDGLLCLHDLSTGHVRFGVNIPQRSSHGPSGAVVYAPGLPKLLIVTEGERSLSAVDLEVGEVRWRYSAKRAANFRVKHAGKLLVIAGGDSALVALDVATGEVVWRLRETLPFFGDVAVDRDSAFALSGGQTGPRRICHVDLWSGVVRWRQELVSPPTASQAPMVTPRAVVVPTRTKNGTFASAFHRDTGKPIWDKEIAAGKTTAFLTVDDTIIANSSSGTLSGLDANTGISHFSHTFSRPTPADQPRRLLPVLRGGALFVPQQEVHVMHPKTGEIFGAVPTDLVPDMLRVDARTNVYVAEESGHLAAFGAAPRLALVKK